MATADFEALIKENLEPYYALSKKFGGPVAEQADCVKKAVDLELALVKKATGMKKPAPAEFQKMLQPISELMVRIGGFKDKNRGHKHFNHLSGVGEGIQALAWVCIEPTPGPHVKETIGSSEFWTNKIRREFKGKDADQIKWVEGYNGFLKALIPYIKQYHTTGLSWNTGGAKQTSAASSGAPAPTSGSAAAFAALIKEHIDPYVAISNKYGGPVKEQAAALKKALDLELELLKKAEGMKKPAPAEFQKMLQPISELMVRIGGFKDKNRGHKHFNHLSGVGEGVQALAWVCIEPTPGPHVKETIGSAEFWTNKIRKEFKGKDAEQIKWVEGFTGFLKALVGYIKQFHTTGLSWNTGGAKSAPSGGAVPAPTGGSSAGFAALIKEHIDPYVAISNKYGGPVKEQAAALKKALDLELELLKKAEGMKKPAPAEFQKMLQPISELMVRISGFKDKNRGHKHFNHLSGVGEGVQALAWVCIEPTPGPHVKETIGSAEFWTNKIRKEFKGKDEEQIKWVEGFTGFLKALVVYIKQHHTTGLTWSTGASRPAASGAGAAAVAGGFGGIIKEFIEPYVALSAKIGGPVAAQAKVFEKAVRLEAELITKAKGMKKPAGAKLQELLQPISTQMMAVSEFQNKHGAHKDKNFIKGVAEGVAVLGWVAVEPAPGPYVKNTIPSSEFWTNKILTEYKGKGETQINWVKAFNGFLKALLPFIKAEHTTGLTWGN